jgi:hypothetical protein
MYVVLFRNPKIHKKYINITMTYAVLLRNALSQFSKICTDAFLYLFHTSGLGSWLGFPGMQATYLSSPHTRHVYPHPIQATGQ